jgi:hypothetical protein
VTAISINRSQSPARRLLHADTYQRTAHLIADPLLGVITFTATATLLTLAAGLSITLLGILLLPLVLLLCRGIGRLERARARVLLHVKVTDPPPTPTGWRRLTDASGWRAVAYSLLLLPSGILTGTITLTGWATAIAAIGFPTYAWRLTDPALHLGGLTIGGPAATVGATIVGVGLILLMPVVVEQLSRVDAFLFRTLLG